MARAVRVLALVLFVEVLDPLVALAHDCSSPRDCEQTAGYNAVLAIVGGVLAIVAALLGTGLVRAAEATQAAAAPGEEAVEEALPAGCIAWIAIIAAAIVATLVAFLSGRPR